MVVIPPACFSGNISHIFGLSRENVAMHNSYFQIINNAVIIINKNTALLLNIF